MNHMGQITPKSQVPLGRKIFRKVEPYLYLVPAFLFIIAFTYYPFIKTMGLSFFRLNKYRKIREFVGLANYAKVLGDEKFIQAIGNTLIFVIATVPISMLGLHSPFWLGNVPNPRAYKPCMLYLWRICFSHCHDLSIGF